MSVFVYFSDQRRIDIVLFRIVSMRILLSVTYMLSDTIAHMNTKVVAKALWLLSLGALALSPLTLFYVDTSLLFPYIAGKNFAWRLLIEIAFVAWIGSALLDSKYRIDIKNPLLVAVGLFCLVTLIANLLSPDPHLAFWSTVERMDGFIHLIHLVLYLVTLTGVLKNRKLVTLYLVYLLLISLVLGVGGWGDEGRIDSTLGNPIYLASVAMFGFFISTYLFIKRWVSLGKHEVAKFIRAEYLLLTIAALISIITIFQTGTRGALLGLVAAAIVASILIVLTKGDEYRPFKIIAAIILAAVFASSVLLMTSRDSLAEVTFIQESSMLSRLVKISPEDRTTGFRLANWQMALAGVSERPLTGYGQEGYAEVFSEQFDVEALANAEQWYDRTHNVILDALVFSGVPGLLAYLAIFGIAIFVIYKRSELDPLEKVLLVGTIVGYIAQNLVAFDSLASGIYIYALFAYIIILTSQTKDPQEHLFIRPFVSYGAIGALLICLVWWVNFSIVQPRAQLASYITFLRFSVEPQDNVLAALLPEFQNAVEGKTFVQRELLLQALRQTNRYSNQNITAPVQAEYTGSILRGVDSLDIQNDTRMLLALGSFLSNLNAPRAAIPYLENALERSPNKPYIILQTAVAHERQGDTEEADRLFRLLGDVAPNWSLTERVVGEYEARKTSL